MTEAAIRCLVIGSGSIACRHMKNIKAIRPDAAVACVSASGRKLETGEIPADVVFADLAAALDWKPAFAIVASPAPWHLAHAGAVLEANIPVLIEKPVAAALPQAEAASQFLLANKDRIDVAYNLRYLPSARLLKDLLQQGFLGKIHSVVADVGQYLADWRPQSDYRKNVSARNALGGGVLLELSHELDYLSWLFGRIESVFCNAANTGELEIDVEDRVDALMTVEGGLVVNLHMDFLQHSAHRSCKIIGARGTLIWNLMTNSVTHHQRGGMQSVLFHDPAYDRNDMYIAQLRHFLDLAEGRAQAAVGIESALATLAVVDGLRRSAKEQRMIHLGLPK